MGKLIDIDLVKESYDPDYNIGTLYYDCEGGVWKYVKIIFDIFPEGEAHTYRWIPHNGMARLTMLKIA